MYITQLCSSFSSHKIGAQFFHEDTTICKIKDRTFLENVSSFVSKYVSTYLIGVDQFRLFTVKITSQEADLSYSSDIDLGLHSLFVQTTNRTSKVSDLDPVPLNNDDCPDSSYTPLVTQ